MTATTSRVVATRLARTRNVGSPFGGWCRDGSNDQLGRFVRWHGLCAHLPEHLVAEPFGNGAKICSGLTGWCVTEDRALAGERLAHGLVAMDCKRQHGKIGLCGEKGAD